MKTTNKNQEAPKSKKNIKLGFTNLWELVLVLAEIASAYTFATQSNQVLWVLAGVLGLDASIRLVKRFMVK